MRYHMAALSQNYRGFLATATFSHFHNILHTRKPFVMFCRLCKTIQSRYHKTQHRDDISTIPRRFRLLGKTTILLRNLMSSGRHSQELELALVTYRRGLQLRPGGRQ